MKRILAIAGALSLLTSNCIEASAVTQNRRAAAKHQHSRAGKSDWNRQIGWVTVPVFYVTDRLFDVDAGEINYKEHQTNNLGYGVRNITIPYTAHLNNYAKQLKALGWHILSVNGSPLEKNVSAAEMDYPDRTYTRAQFFDALKHAIANSDRRELLLHVHGCCVDYKNSMVNAAKLEGWYRVPIVMYDWTSPAPLYRYPVNEQTVSTAQSGFNEFVSTFEQEFEPNELAISAHSMGNRLLDNYLVSRHASHDADYPRLRESIFACADVDAKAFAQHEQDVAANSRITRIYISDKDPALLMSEGVHGLHSRLGRPGNKLGGLTQTDKVDVVNDTELYIKHDLPDWLIANMHRYGRPGERDTYDVVKMGNHYYVIEEKHH